MYVINFYVVRLESWLVFKGGIVRALTTALKMSIATPLMLFLTFIVFTASGGELTPRKLFTVLSLIEFLKRSCISYATTSLFFIYEARVALVRIQVSLWEVSRQTAVLNEIDLHRNFLS